MRKQHGSVSLLVVGAGDRGNVYADYVRGHPDAGYVVAVAEPDPAARAAFAERHALPPNRCFPDWTVALDTGRLADAVLAPTDGWWETGAALSTTTSAPVVATVAKSRAPARGMAAATRR